MQGETHSRKEQEIEKEGEGVDESEMERQGGETKQDREAKGD